MLTLIGKELVGVVSLVKSSWLINLDFAGKLTSGFELEGGILYTVAASIVNSL
jgi:hypothetical protein